MAQQTAIVAQIRQFRVDGGRPVIHAVDQRGDLIDIDGTMLPPGLRQWPEEGEIWLVERHFTAWRLSHRIAVDSSYVPLPGFKPGNQTLYGIREGEPSSDAHYRHVQDTAAMTWTINHGLGKRPSVEIVDTANTRMYAEIEWPDDNTVVLTFSSAVAGSAHLN